MDFPTDDVLIARGKYSTLQRERHAAIRSVRTACEAIQAQARLVLKDAEADLDHEDAPLDAMKRRHDEITELFRFLRSLNTQIAEVKPQAWPEDK